MKQHLNKQRTMIIGAALAVVIGGGAAMQVLAREAAHTVRLIDPASLVVALSEGAAPATFANSFSYASAFEAAPAVTTASFAGESAAAPVIDLAGVAAAVSGQAAAAETFGGTTAYAGTLRAANLSSDASFQRTGGVVTTALFDLEGVAAAFADDVSAEQTQFADESSYASGLREAYLEDGFDGGTFSGAVAAEAPALDLGAVAAATGGAPAPTDTFAGQTSYVDSLGAAYMPVGFNTGTFSNAVSAGPVIDLAGVAAASAEMDSDAATATFSGVSSYAGSLSSANLDSTGASFAADLAAPGNLFDLETLGESLSDGE